DLVETIVGTASFSGPLVVRYGVGGGAFGPASAAIAPDLHSGDAIDVADLDGDGDLDVGTAHGARVVYLNDGYGGFAATLVLPSGPAPTTGFGVFAALDVDADGLLDVLAGPTSFGGANGIDIYRRTGPGLSFAPAVYQPVAAYSFADVDGDGD